MIGIVQYMTLIAIEIGDDDANSLTKRLSEVMGKTVHFGQVYTTIRQLMTANLVGYGPNRERKTCTARSYVLTSKGKTLLAEMDKMMDAAYNMPRIREADAADATPVSIDLEDIIQHFGTVSNTARALRIGIPTVSGWRNRSDGRIPAYRRDDIIRRAVDAGMPAPA